MRQKQRTTMRDVTNNKRLFYFAGVGLTIIVCCLAVVIYIRNSEEEVSLTSPNSASAQLALTDVTKVYTISANDRDAWSGDAHSGQAAHEVRINGYNNTNEPYEFVSNDSDAESAGMEFALDIPKGATIKNSFITVRAVSFENISPTGGLAVHLYNTANATPFTNGFFGDLVTHHPTYPNTVTWQDNTAWAAGADKNSPDMSSFIQTFVNRADYTPGNYIGFAITEGTIQSGKYYGWEDFTAGHPAKLTVTYTTNASSTPGVSPTNTPIAAPTNTPIATRTPAPTPITTPAVTPQPPLSTVAPLPSVAPITYRQSKISRSSNYTTNQKLTFWNAVTKGNLMVVAVSARRSQNDGGAPQISSVTDSKGNIYTKAIQNQIAPSNSQEHSVSIWYAKNVVGGYGFAVTATAAQPSYISVAAHEYAGLSKITVLDQVAGSSGNSTSASTGKTPVTTSSRELVFGAFLHESPSSIYATKGLGFTTRQSLTNGVYVPLITEDKFVSVPGQYDASLSWASPTNWRGVVATFIGQ